MGHENLRKSRRSQVTIFVIIAIIIAAILGFLFYPNLKEIIMPSPPGELAPKACIESAVRSSLNLSMMHGGYINPALYFRHNNLSIGYLCYTGEWYKTCVMQNPMLKQTIEAEAYKNANPALRSCIKQMEDRLISRGYSLKTSGSKEAKIEIEPGLIAVSFNITLNLEKGEEKIAIPANAFNMALKSSAYEIIMIASSIQNWEARYGDSAPESYTAFYPNLKVQKLKQDDGTKVYIITDRETGERLQFATRSLAWPPGLDIPRSFAQA